MENCAVFCDAAASLRDAFGCTLIETDLTCQRWLDKKRLREGARSLSLAAAAEFTASSTSSPSLKLTTRAWLARSADRKRSTSPESARSSRAFASRG